MIKRPAQGITGTTQTRKMLAPAGPASGRIATGKGHQARSQTPRFKSPRNTSGRGAIRPASFSGGCGVSGRSCNTQTHHRRRRDDADPRFENRLARDRASRSARASCGRRAWRGCGSRRGHVALASCVTPRGAGASLKASHVAA